MSSRSGGRLGRAAAAGRAGASLLVAVALLLPAEPARAQNFFERLFRPAQPQPQPQAPAPRPQPQSQPQGQPRRSAPTQPGQPGQAAQPNAPQQPAPPPQQEGPPPPYEPELLRLAEIMGSLAFLRQLCAMPDAAEWPRRMQALLEAEGTTPGRRERIAGAYNRGFRAYGLTYRVCTPSATEATNRYLKEGEQIARNMSTRYGG